MNLNFTINKHIDLTKIVSSMQLNSGITLATLEVDEYKFTVETQGDVRVLYNPDHGPAREGDTYRYPSDFPEELMGYFNGDIEHDEKPDFIEVYNSNWLELFRFKDGKLIDSDVLEDEDCRPDRLFKMLWDTYRQEVSPAEEKVFVVTIFCMGCPTEQQTEEILTDTEEEAERIALSGGLFNHASGWGVLHTYERDKVHTVAQLARECTAVFNLGVVQTGPFKVEGIDDAFYLSSFGRRNGRGVLLTNDKDDKSLAIHAYLFPGKQGEEPESVIKALVNFIKTNYQ